MEVVDKWQQAYSADTTSTEPNGTAPGAPGAKSDAPPEPVFASVEEWVVSFFAELIRRKPKTSFMWCPRWWDHGEAVLRLEGMWRAWEALRLDGTTGMSVWARDHLDPHLRSLTDPETSPFAGCIDGSHTQFEPLEVVPAPPGTWDDAESADAAGEVENN